jgi:hypothetical protein
MGRRNLLELHWGGMSVHGTKLPSTRSFGRSERARSSHSLHLRQTAAMRTERSSDQNAQMTGLDPKQTFMFLDAKPMPANQLPSTTGSFSATRWCFHRPPLALNSAATRRSHLDDPGWDSAPGPVRASIGTSEWAIIPVVDSVYRTEAWNSARRSCVSGRRVTGIRQQRGLT